jgi:hypothetical protein
MDTTSAGRCCPPAARRGRRPCRTRGVSDLIASTALDRRLGIAFLIPHGGAPLPLLAGRPQMFRDVFLADAAKACQRDIGPRRPGQGLVRPGRLPVPASHPTLTQSDGTDDLLDGSDSCFAPPAAVAAQRVGRRFSRSCVALRRLSSAAWMAMWKSVVLDVSQDGDNSSRAAVPWGFCHTVEPAADVSHQGMTNDEHGLTQTRDDFRPRIGRRALSSSRDHVRGGRET